MRIIILGGDGFCGWPTTLHLSSKGYEVLIVDNLSRRLIEHDLGSYSLTPIKNIQDRIKCWYTLTGKKIHFHCFDIAKEYDKLYQLFIEYKPDAIVHFAEQRSAPYSMLSVEKKQYTVNNNINATHNVLLAMLASQLNIHLVHLGTMGVYGYGAIEGKVPEGYLDVFTKDANEQLHPHKILYPANPGSVYHMTKTLDALMFQFYNKNDKLRITDLHQGIVWGTETPETRLHLDLINRFDYDGEYGTVLNRFLVQSVINHPLTVYGSGGQTRGFIHIKNTTECIALALENPPEKNTKVQIFNQVTETHKVIDLANLVSKLTNVAVQNCSNPRNELAENNLDVVNEQFIKLNLKPTMLSEGLLEEIRNIIKPYIHLIDNSKINSLALWSKDKTKL